MATDMVDSLLMSLPLELRHKCFEYAAVRDTKPKNLLRYWFEKKEVKELVATAVAANPTGPAPTVIYHQELDEDDTDVPQPDEEEEEEQDGEDNEDEDGEDDEDEVDNEEENEDEDGDDMADHDQAIQAAIQAAITQAQYAALPPGHPSAASTTTQTQTQQVPVDDQANAPELEAGDEEVDAAAGEAKVPAANTTAGGSQDADGDETMTEENDEDDEPAENEDEDGEDGEDAEADAEDGAGGDGSAAAPQQPIPAPPVPVVTPARKWRHIPNFMRLTHCPPPVELLLASKQLNDEAKNWFYDVAILRINATGAFAHTSFFEEAFDQITQAAFSPMENVRKVEVLFSWDTTWLRADTTGCAEAIFPALLRQRSEFVHKILSQAPDLKDVTIHWHDSAEDNESANFMLDILAPFHSLNAHLAIKEHYIAVNAKPNSRSIAGQRRVEFQAIMDAGLDRLF